MKPFAWSYEKNEQLLAARGLCFEAVIVAIETGNLLVVREHPNPQRYPEFPGTGCGSGGATSSGWP